MEDDGCLARNFFRTVDLVVMEPMCRFPEQGAFTLTEVLRTINDFLGQDGGH